MRDRLVSERQLAERLGRDDPLWPGQLATLTALLLYLVLPRELTLGPGWTVPVAEAAVLGALVLAARGGRAAQARRRVAIGLVVVAALFSLIALGLLADHLVSGSRVPGGRLIGGGLLIWSTNLLLFGVLYSELDRGGPVRPGTHRDAVMPDFLFPQMTDGRYSAPGWTPGFGDYLYVSLTNQTAFSPTDTMPLTSRAKLLMGVQGAAALVTTGIVVAHAVNILA
jgi:hypothetical protein